MRRHQANPRAGQEISHRRSWTRPASERAPSLTTVSSADKIVRHTYELEAPDNRDAETIQRAREKMRNIERSSVGWLPPKERDMISTELATGSSSHLQRPSVSSKTTSSTAHNNQRADSDTSDHFKSLTINFSTTEDLENFLKTFKGAHGADHAASHIIYPENSGIEDSPMSVRLFTGRPAFVLSRHPSAESLATRPDAVSFTSGSTSTPPIIPDFPWRSQPSLAFELPNKDLSPEKGV